MRIAILAQSYPPMVSGAALFAEQLAEAMAKRGHQVMVIAASDRGKTYLVERGNLSILRLHSHHNPLRVGQRFLLYPRHAILRALQDFQPEVIHTHEPLQMGLLGVEYARRARIPILLTIHQLPWFVASYLPDVDGLRGHVEAALWMYARWLLRQFTSIITPTQTISTLIADMTNVQSQTISYGIDLETFHPPLARDEGAATRARLNLPADDVPLILHVGRLDADKHVERIVQAAAQAMCGTNAHLLIVGDGLQKSRLIKMCESLGIAERAHFTGYMTVQEGLPAVYRLGSVFVTASEIETQGIVLLEAAASGLPLVAVRATCIPEIVCDEVNGYLTAPGNINAMGEAIRTLLENPIKAKAMGETSRALVEVHNTQRTMDAHEQLYEELIKQLGRQHVQQNDPNQ